jgi:hypothetical protein
VCVLPGDEPGCKGLQQFSVVYAAVSSSSNHPIKHYAALCVHYNLTVKLTKRYHAN